MSKNIPTEEYMHDMADLENIFLNAAKYKIYNFGIKYNFSLEEIRDFLSSLTVELFYSLSSDYSLYLQDKLFAESQEKKADLGS